MDKQDNTEGTGEPEHIKKRIRESSAIGIVTSLRTFADLLQHEDREAARAGNGTEVRK